MLPRVPDGAQVPLAELSGTMAFLARPAGDPVTGFAVQGVGSPGNGSIPTVWLTRLDQRQDGIAEGSAHADVEIVDTLAAAQMVAGLEGSQPATGKLEQ